MNRVNNRIINQAILIVLFALFISACKDPVEGCLDIEASNYNVAADNPCPDCCTYPRINLEVFHSFQDSFRFSYDSLYIFEGNVGRFEEVVFYLSEFKLFGSSDTLEVNEVMSFDIINGGAESFKDDFTLVSRSILSFDYDIGEIRGSGQYDNLSFVVGLLGNAEFINVETVPEDHALALSVDSTIWTYPEGYVFNRVIIIPDTMEVNSKRQFDLKGPSDIQRITLPFPQSLDLGSSVTIPLKIDYKKWFSGINFVAEDSVTITEKIVTNTTNAFSIDN